MTAQTAVDKLNQADSPKLDKQRRREIHTMIDACKAGAANERLPEWLQAKVNAILEPRPAIKGA